MEAFVIASVIFVGALVVGMGSLWIHLGVKWLAIDSRWDGKRQLINPEIVFGSAIALVGVGIWIALGVTLL